MTHANTWEQDGVVKRFEGFVSAEEFATSAEEIACHPNFGRIRFIIDDMLEAQGFELDKACIERIAISHIGSQYTNPNIRIAVVTCGNAIARMAQMLAHPWFGDTYETQVFASVVQARQWLQSQPILRKVPKRFSLR